MFYRHHRSSSISTFIYTHRLGSSSVSPTDISVLLSHASATFRHTSVHLSVYFHNYTTPPRTCHLQQLCLGHCYIHIQLPERSQYITVHHTVWQGFQEIERLLENQSTMSTAHHPIMHGTTKQTHHRTWKLFPTLEFLFYKKITPERKESFKIDEILGPMIYRLKFPETLEDKSCSN